MVGQLLLVCVFILTIQGNGFAQQCLHGQTESDAEKGRRNGALSFARQVNTAQHRYRQQTGRFGSLQEIAAHVQRAYSKDSKMTPSGELKDLEGFEVKFVLDASQYMLTIKDATDPCWFAFSTDDNGVILQSYPIDSPFWRAAPAPRKRP